MSLLYMPGNIAMFRVECPKCRLRRTLNEEEKTDCLIYQEYQAYQFCSDKCKNKANAEEHFKVIERKNNLALMKRMKEHIFK